MTASSSRITLSLAVATLLLAVALLIVGALTERKVYDRGADDFGILSFQKVPEYQMVIDATFGGIERRDERLYSTYDRTVEKGKRKCPT